MRFQSTPHKQQAGGRKSGRNRKHGQQKLGAEPELDHDAEWNALTRTDQGTNL
jgi:hypothetical protein